MFTRYSNLARRVMRSATRLQSTIATPIITSEPATPPRRKNAIAIDRSGSPTPSGPPVTKTSSELPELPEFIEPPYDPVLIPPALKFSFEEAKAHLIGADRRFESVSAALKCGPFERLWPVDPFRSLIDFIFKQHPPQPVPESIRHRFLRLFDRSLPESVSRTRQQRRKYTFPSPGRLASVNKSILITTGLPEGTAEYVLDLANQFADGRLSTQKLIDASDEELVEMLTAVQGIEKLTADLFAIYSLHRPDILIVGDLGIQKGLLNWVISSHEPDRYPLRINPKKLPKANEDEPEKPEDSKATAPGEASISTAKASSSSSEQPDSILLIPEAPVQLPEGMTLEMLKARLDDEKVDGGRYLLPSEMEALTASWRPYRSLGVIYLRALAGQPK